ncbi:MAG: Na+/H+ antiporter subunit E [Candidatus Thermoplasmatota archaeon]|nr:Na+/H+ antiporter subunit E [Candidatus Thermoplasmatota archaeon]
MLCAALVTFLISFLFYLLLTVGPRTYFPQGILYWDWSELIAGIILSAIAAVVAYRIFLMKKNYRMLNPRRWLMFICYLAPFFLAMAKANLDVAYRVITGKIKPGIVKIKTNLKTDLGLTLLANSITLTPGTLSVDVDEKTNDLYIHWIYVRNKEPTAEEVCGSFPKWARRIAE